MLLERAGEDDHVINVDQCEGAAVQYNSHHSLEVCRQVFEPEGGSGEDVCFARPIEKGARLALRIQRALEERLHCIQRRKVSSAAQRPEEIVDERQWVVLIFNEGIESARIQA